MWDIKTGNEEYMDFWYAAWQLKLYSLMFLTQTGLHVHKLGVWYFARNDKGTLEMKAMDVSDWVSNADMMKLLESRITGEMFTGDKVPMLPEHKAALLAFDSFAKTVGSITRELEAKKEQFDMMKEAITGIMEKYHLLSMDITPTTHISYIKGHTVKRVDSQSLKIGSPETYNNYLTATEYKPTIRVKVKGENKWSQK
jgi:hypothetical protein